MKLSLFIGLRYIKSKKTHNVINIISWIATVGICITTAALIIVLSVFNGFKHLVGSIYTSFDPDIVILAQKGKVFNKNNININDIYNIENIKSAYPIIEDNVLLKHQSSQVVAKVKGVEANYFQDGKLENNIISGKTLRVDNNFASIGYGLAYFLGLNINLMPQQISIITPKRKAHNLINPASAFNIDKLYVSSVFSIQQEIDDKYIFIPIEVAKKLFNYNEEISAIEISLKDYSKVNNTKAEIANIIGTDFIIKDHEQQQDTLYKVMKTEKLAVFFILSLIIFISALNIISSLSMLIISKEQDIAILHSLGAQLKSIKHIFLAQGIILTMSGATIGLILGFIICFLQQKLGIISLGDGTSFLVNKYPVSMLLSDFILVFLTVLIIGLLTSLIPVAKLKVNLKFNRK